MFDFSDIDRRQLQGGENCSPNILEVARLNSDFELAVNLFERAGFADIFTCPGPFTVNIPTNDAINSIDASLIDFLVQPENIGELQNLLFYHIIPGVYRTTTWVEGPQQTLLGSNVELGLNPTMVNEATVILSDIPGCNGLINGLDQVLTFLPPGTYRENNNKALCL